MTERPGRKVTQAEAAWIAQQEVGPQVNLERADRAATTTNEAKPRRLSHQERTDIYIQRERLKLELTELNHTLEPLLRRKHEIETTLGGINITFQDQAVILKADKKKKRAQKKKP